MELRCDDLHVVSYDKTTGEENTWLGQCRASVVDGGPTLNRLCQSVIYMWLVRPQRQA